MYQLTTGSSILRLADNALIPPDSANLDYQAYLNWLAGDNTPTAIDQAELVSVYTAGILAHLNSVANANEFDSIYTAALRAGFAGPLQAKGLALAQWMEDCWEVSKTVQADVLAELRPMPMLAELILELPELVL